MGTKMKSTWTNETACKCYGSLTLTNHIIVTNNAIYTYFICNLTVIILKVTWKLKIGYLFINSKQFQFITVYELLIYFALLVG